jgi:hypothetical protein
LLRSTMYKKIKVKAQATPSLLIECNLSYSSRYRIPHKPPQLQVQDSEHCWKCWRNSQKCVNYNPHRWSHSWRVSFLRDIWNSTRPFEVFKFNCCQ